MKQLKNKRTRYTNSIENLIYWASKSPEERVSAVEILRQQWYKINNERPKRLRRILRIIKRAES